MPLHPVVEAVLTLGAENPFSVSEKDALRVMAELRRTLQGADESTRLAFVFDALAAIPGASSWTARSALKAMAGELLRAGLPLTPADAVRLVERVSQPGVSHPYKQLLGALKDVPMTADLSAALTHLRPMITEWHGGPTMRDLHERIGLLVNGAAADPVFEPAGTWTRAVFAEIEKLPASARWKELFQYCRDMNQSLPTKKWLAAAVTLAEAIGRDEVLAAAGRWLALGPMPDAPGQIMPEGEAAYLTGFLWTLAAIRATPSMAAVGDFAAACFRKIPQLGAVSHRTGNACVNVLAAMPGLDAVSQLSRLASRVKYDVAQRLIEKALAEAAQRNGVSREDLEAMAVPRFGLDGEGKSAEAGGDGEGRLEIEGFAAKLTFLRNGKPVSSGIPAPLKKQVKELGEALATQRLRLERLLANDGWTPLVNWHEWYLDHPLMRPFTRALVWELEAGPTVMHDGEAFIDWSGSAVEPDPGVCIRLWHPIRTDVQTALSWRCRLEDLGVTQPFKQAHREVYLLTAAERETRTHSNRFAGHILQQHQFAALCRERGWRFRLMGQWDSHNTPTLELPRHGLRAEYGVDFPHDEGAVSSHAIYLTIRTGPLAFYRGDREPVPLEEVPPAVFSETMRDLDLFTGVTSIGADPSWAAGRADDQHLPYWREFTHGELSEAAENRKAVLASLIPKLAIGGKCRIDGRYLHVQGKLHDYRIHLGSANVFMEPGSRHLCIVQGGGDPRVRLPFEGDRILSLILSKAFLLVNDSSIRDPSIRSQTG